MEEKVLKEATLGFLIKDKRIWLAMKTQKIGMGCWNGYGGGIEPGDKNPIESLKREMSEECGVRISTESVEKVAEINFHNTKSTGEISLCKMYVFFIKEWSGEPKESSEMASPTLFEINSLPFEKMMPADKEWLPMVLEGKKLIAEYYYGPFQKELNGESKIEIVKNFPTENSKELKIPLR